LPHSPSVLVKLFKMVAAVDTRQSTVCVLNWAVPQYHDVGSIIVTRSLQQFSTFVW
jgi:hypothetical protein